MIGVIILCVTGITVLLAVVTWSLMQPPVITTVALLLVGLILMALGI